MDEGFCLCFGVRFGVDLSFISVFINLHIIQKRIRKYMSHRNICFCLYVIQKRIRKFMPHRNICFCLYVCHSTSPCSRHVPHSGIKWTISSVQASALNVLSQFPFKLSGLYPVSFNRRQINETGASFSFIPHFVSHCSVRES
jgi:hypothetical protein